MQGIHRAGLVIIQMGDNRDNSVDSRVESTRNGVLCAYENLIWPRGGRFFLNRVDDSCLSVTSPWTWPFDVRWSRI